MHKSLFILGRQPAIGRAELESLFGAANLKPVSEHAMLCSKKTTEVNFARLGGSTRLASVLAEVPTSSWPSLAEKASKALSKLVADLPDGKIKLGLSCFGLPVNAQQLLRTGLELKKTCRRAGHSARVVPNTDPALSSAQVLHNQLTGELGIELLFVSDGKITWVAQTDQVQDINAYARRDQGRPKRDARVGMLPPKLAQTIVNLATADADPAKTTLLDPFCGTGVILQEALLDGFAVYGTDLEPRMIDFSKHNLEWLRAITNLPNDRVKLEAGDATTHQWHPAPGTVASETYLGRPLSSWPAPETLQEIIGTCNVIIEKSLANLATQVLAGTRLCLALPAWKSPSGRIYHLPVLDHLEKMGYNQVSFEHARNKDLVYIRPEQLVGRELLVITRN